jgi:3-ketosteroid 9alpha-monooxygenase subunit A
MRLRARASGWFAAAPHGVSVVGRPTCERHGVVLAYVGDGAPWPLAPIEPEHEARRWSRPARRRWRIRTHPQEIIENTVDIAHFTSVHGYRAVEVTRAMQTDGPHLRMSYAVNRGPLRMALDITASGVGYSRVQVDVHGLRLRTVVMPTPLDAELTEVRAITQVALPGLPGAAIVGAGLGQLAATAMGHDFAADIAIWEHKRYQDPPRVCAGDGPIGPYRTWARQFLENAA